MKGGDRSGAGEHYRVAIVDDQYDIRQLLAVRLAMVGNLDVVGQAANGSEAIDLARLVQPDLMTLDLLMPGMGGLEAIPLLRMAAPHMRILVFSSTPTASALVGGHRPDAVLAKGGSLAELVDAVLGLLAERPQDVVDVDLGRLPVRVAVAAFDSWVGLNARVRGALSREDDVSVQLLGEATVEPADLQCLMGVFMQFGPPVMEAVERGDTELDLKFTVQREAGASARRALLALGGNGTLRAFNQAWSHSPSLEARTALDLVDARLVEALPV